MVKSWLILIVLFVCCTESAIICYRCSTDITSNCGQSFNPTGIVTLNTSGTFCIVRFGDLICTQTLICLSL